jgi:hypothetical protein
MTTPSDYSVRLNLKDGALEISGPDKDWIDAKIDQLRDTVLAGFEPSTGERQELRKQPKRKNTKKVATSPSHETEGDRPTAKRSRGTSTRSSIDEELQARLTSEVRAELQKYVDARRKAWNGSQSAQAAIIATFLHDKLGLEGVDQHDLYTVYTVMGERTPGNIRSQLTNARQRSRYFAGLQDGKMVLSHAGENFARLDSLTSDDDVGPR